MRPLRPPRPQRPMRRLGTAPTASHTAPPAPASWLTRLYDGSARLARMLARQRILPGVPPLSSLTSRAQWAAERRALHSALQVSQDALHKAQAELHEIQQIAGLGRWSYDAETGAITLSGHLKHMLDLGGEWLPSTLDELLELVVEADKPLAQASLSAVLRAPRRLAGELRMRDSRGLERWFLATLESQHRARRQPLRVQGTLLDVTARRLAEDRAERMAYHDDLTGLPNRASFLAQLDQAVQHATLRSSRLALLFLDLDGFKEINDSLGHDAGDALLKEIASRVRGCLRQSDRLSRFGGDEFLVLIDPVRRRRDVIAIAQKILTAVATPVALQGLMASVSASIGVALFPEDGDNSPRLLKNADAAMYNAKHNGRNRMQFYVPEINASLLEKLALTNDLRSAIAQNGITAFYQPIVDGRTGQMLGMEALARWHHPERGFVPPGCFIPLAEETGLISDLGQQVLNKACHQIADWDRQGLWAGQPYPAPYVSVNISPVQLRAPQFVAQLKELLRDAQLAPDRLQIELTEGTVMADPQRAGALLGEVAKLGVRVAVDDFGTGHSSLACLRDFPIHCIKIDRAFVRDLSHGSREDSIVPAMIAIAQSLHATVIAEGVEHDLQRQTLLAMRCPIMQGYWFSRPLDPASLAAHIASTRTETTPRIAEPVAS